MIKRDMDARKKSESERAKDRTCENRDEERYRAMCTTAESAAAPLDVSVCGVALEAGRGRRPPVRTMPSALGRTRH